MNSDELFELFQGLRNYIGWSEDDQQRVAKLHSLIEPGFEDLIDDFYAEIQRTPGASRVITGGEGQIRRLKASLLEWIRNLFVENYDREFVQRRWEVGLRHVSISLEQVYPHAAMSRLRNRMLDLVGASHQGTSTELIGYVKTLNRLIDLDLALIECAYQFEFNRRVRINERYATIGRVSGGIAHELRNPLNVIQTSVYYLLNAKQASPEKTLSHLERIERQVSRCDGIITTLTDSARLQEPSNEPVDLERLITETIAENVSHPDISVEVNLASDARETRGEGKQLRLAFGNLIRNACEAMAQGGALEIRSKRKENTIVLTFSDSGCGIPEEKLAEITEPLYTTKASGIGLGLAVATAILERHNAYMRIQSEIGNGSTFEVFFPEISDVS